IFACFGCKNNQNNTSTNTSSSNTSQSGVSSSSSFQESVIQENLDYIDISLDTLTSLEQQEVDKLFYQNDLTMVSADPACVYCKDDGYFYLYGTGDGGQNFNCYKSTNLTSWEKLDNAFTQAKNLTYSQVESVLSQEEFDTYQANTWVKYGYTWAPGVIYDKDLDLYLMYFSAMYTTEETVTKETLISYQISLATSKTPNGPFIQWTGKVNGQNGKSGVENITYANGQTVPAYELGYQDRFLDFEKLKDINGNYPYEGYMQVIDAEPFVDPVTGDKYLFFTRDITEHHDLNEYSGKYYSESCSMGIKMIDWFTPDYSTLTLLTRPNYTKVSDTSKDPYSQEGKYNEGQYVVYNEQNDLYYLTYSCNATTERTYKVNQAWSKNPLGPYTKVSDQKGGNVIGTDLEWIHRAGTGHHVLTKVGNELFIIYHMHKNPINYASENWKSRRVIGIDKISWVENEDNILVMSSGGPSYDYRLRPSLFTGYSNLASLATVAVSQQKANAQLKYLTDGAIQMKVREGLYEFDANRDTLEVELTFNTPITLKGVMAFNSYFVETAFDSIRYIQVEYTKNNGKYLGTTGAVSFNWDKYYYNNLPDGSDIPLYIPGCSSSAIFKNEIPSVTKIKINFKRQAIKNDKPHVPTGLSVSDICVIGK
ncbi:MAG: family 43 glycosylhydrolase, partial [Clostridia bacterium]|nr:family 43 glycosylhydrolase [Clostridia bacterium]